MPKQAVLIVDDEKNIRLTLGTCLEAAGYAVELAVNGEEGIAKAREGDYQLVFLDMKMPGMDGIAVLKNLKELHPALNVVMMTAYGTVETAVTAMKLGAVDYLRKPFSPEELLELTETIMRRQTLAADQVQDYHSIVELAKGFIVKQQFGPAKEWLQKAVAMDTVNPTAFNLLGVMYEMEGELQLGQKMYRAALSIDPSYTPAIENLNRSAQWQYTQQGMNLGETEK
jgi:DNA-binding response OmpR family regulator